MVGVNLAGVGDWAIGSSRTGLSLATSLNVGERMRSLHDRRTPMDAPLVGRIPSSGRMRGAAVVPDDEVTGLPLVPVLGVGLQHVPVELGQQPVAFGFGHVEDAGDMDRIDIERFSPCLAGERAPRSAPRAVAPEPRGQANRTLCA